MSIHELAPELLSRCLKNLSHSDLDSASLVCADWLAASREIYWDRVSLNLNGELPSNFVSLLRGKTSIPRRIGGIAINERDLTQDSTKDEIADWQDSLVTILRHFESVKSLTIGHLDLSKCPRQYFSLLCRPNPVARSLVIQNLVVQSHSDAISLIAAHQSLTFLGLGAITTSKENRDEASADVDSSSPPTETLHLPKLGHLVVFSDVQETWINIVPAIQRASLESLRTLVAVCDNPTVVSGLISSSASTLRSLALGLTSEGPGFDLHLAESLTNLSFDISRYPAVESLLSSLEYTVASNSTLQRIFINCGPTMLRPEKQLDNAAPLWESLDSYLSSLQSLESITALMVVESCMSMFMHMPGSLGGVFDQWKNDLLKYFQEKLPLCHERGLLQVVQVPDSWTSHPFADIDIPE